MLAAGLLGSYNPTLILERLGTLEVKTRELMITKAQNRNREVVIYSVLTIYIYIYTHTHEMT